MKKILVPIDFSDYADNAVKYAIAMANTMPASLHLCHAINVPEINPMGGIVAYPLEDYRKIKEDSDISLQQYIEKLKVNNLPITYSSELGTVQQIVEDLAKKLRADMVVMGMAGAGKLAHIIFGSNSLAMIERSSLPILLVPKNATFTGLQKVAFATDLTASDLNSIQKLAHLFYTFNTDILLTHVNVDENKKEQHQTKIDRFINDVICKVNYSKIYYRQVEEQDIDKGLSWLTKNAQIDMLAMVHRHLNAFKRIVKGSHTKNIANQIDIPLLVLPEDAKEIGW